ncbi:hypothetical protein [Pseudovibrio sp. Alg231-02]|uniref:hypothetical protein n=1 Tax=Pseudovibrio sp. Alg231-02 TaxID=1922223 RepID=UPI000D54F95B|nr:hypothetical protein [Pseudovibrio sp. Alg231-02]
MRILLFPLIALLISGCVATKPHGYQPNVTVNTYGAQLYLNTRKAPQFRVTGWSEAPLREFSMAINYYAAEAALDEGYSHFVLLDHKRTQKGSGHYIKAKFLGLKRAGTHKGKRALNAKQLLRQLHAQANIKQVGPRNKFSMSQPTPTEAIIVGGIVDIAVAAIIAAN